MCSYLNTYIYIIYLYKYVCDYKNICVYSSIIDYSATFLRQGFHAENCKMLCLSGSYYQHRQDHPRFSKAPKWLNIGPTSGNTSIGPRSPNCLTFGFPGLICAGKTWFGSGGLRSTLINCLAPTDYCTDLYCTISLQSCWRLPRSDHLTHREPRQSLSVSFFSISSMFCLRCWFSSCTETES